MSLGILFDVGKAYGSVSKTDDAGTITSLDLDVMQDEVHEWKNDVTQFPVEIGSQITDHIQSLPDNVTVTGIISNSAIGVDALSAQEGGEDRCQTSFDLLRKFYEDRTLLTVYTRYKVYIDMALKSCNIPRDAGIGDSIKFKLEFVNVRMVDTQTVDVPAGISKKLDKKSGDGVIKKTQPPASGGKKETKPVYQSDKSGAKQASMTEHDKKIEADFLKMNGYQPK